MKKQNLDAPNFASMLVPGTESFANPNILTGTDIKTFITANNLSQLEGSSALGINGSALYTKQGADRIGATISILVRLYCAFPQHIPRTLLPTVDEFVTSIQKIDPSFKMSHLGPLLGLEKNSSHRFNNQGFDSATPMVKALIILIMKIVKEAPEHWDIIKSVVELEATAHSVIPKETIWTTTRWRRAIKENNPAPKGKISSSGSPTRSNTVNSIIRTRKA